jgi:hypothetical protein
MARVKTTCVICKKEFITFDSNFQIYCSVGCQIDSIHSADCAWFNDWHKCSCGAFDILEIDYKNNEVDNERS